MPMAQDKRVALITGANKGIGLETARQLGREGIIVIAAARDFSKERACRQNHCATKQSMPAR